MFLIFPYSFFYFCLISPSPLCFFLNILVDYSFPRRTRSSSSLFRLNNGSFLVCNSSCFHDKMKLPWRLHQTTFCFPPLGNSSKMFKFSPTSSVCPFVNRTCFLLFVLFIFFFSVNAMMYKLWWSSKLGWTFISLLMISNLSISRLVHNNERWWNGILNFILNYSTRWLGASQRKWRVISPRLDCAVITIQYEMNYDGLGVGQQQNSSPMDCRRHPQTSVTCL